MNPRFRLQSPASHWQIGEHVVGLFSHLYLVTVQLRSREGLASWVCVALVCLALEKRTADTRRFRIAYCGKHLTRLSTSVKLSKPAEVDSVITIPQTLSFTSRCTSEADICASSRCPLLNVPLGFALACFLVRSMGEQQSRGKQRLCRCQGNPQFLNQIIFWGSLSAGAMRCRDGKMCRAAMRLHLGTTFWNAQW